jgi:DegV family protein with EDD domain
VQRIKLITDSASDIPCEIAKQLDITIMAITITHEGKSYRDGIDLTENEFFDLLLNSNAIPTTSHITANVYYDEYKKALDEDFTHIINITINSEGSSMFDSATLASQLFKDEIGEKISIEVIDSKTYTIAYGIAVIHAAKMVKQGNSAEEIIAYLKDWFDRVEIIFSVYSLSYAKKSGRISVASAFVGELMGLRPIISMVDGFPKIIDRIRGDKFVVDGVVQNVMKRQVHGNDYPCAIIKGIYLNEAEELAEKIKLNLNLESINLYFAGASIAINCGPKVIGVIFAGAKRIYN